VGRGTDEADGAFVAELGEDLEHFWRDGLGRSVSTGSRALALKWWTLHVWLV